MPVSEVFEGVEEDDWQDMIKEEKEARLAYIVEFAD